MPPETLAPYTAPTPLVHSPETLLEAIEWRPLALLCPRIEMPDAVREAVMETVLLADAVLFETTTSTRS